MSGVRGRVVDDEATAVQRNGAAHVIGIDPSLTGTGIARVTQDGIARVTHFGRKGKRDESLWDRAKRTASIRDDVADWITGEPLDPASDHWTSWPNPELVVIEAPAPSRQGGSSWDRAHLWWQLVEIGIGPLHATPTVQVAPNTRAKWATGRGNADKGAVSAAMARLWPDVEIDCDNCADALALASMAAQQLGWLDPLARHREVLDRITWPREDAA